MYICASWVRLRHVRWLTAMESVYQVLSVERGSIVVPCHRLSWSIHTKTLRFGTFSWSDHDHIQLFMAKESSIYLVKRKQEWGSAMPITERPLSCGIDSSLVHVVIGRGVELQVITDWLVTVLSKRGWQQKCQQRVKNVPWSRVYTRLELHSLACSCVDCTLLILPVANFYEHVWACHIGVSCCFEWTF